LLLSRLLHLQGIESVVLERRDRDYVEHRVRAGVLEYGSVETLREADVAGRLDTEGLVHEGVELRFTQRGHRIDFRDLIGRWITVYGQQEVVKDLIAALLADGVDIRFEVEDVALSDLDTDLPRIGFVDDGEQRTLECDFVVGADGFHGVSREHIAGLTLYERNFPFAWLGILAEAPPSSAELIYSRHRNGFALHSMRSPAITRMYLQVSLADDVGDWPDERIWAELQTRLATEDGFALTEGPLVDKGITSMRSVVSSSMQYGRLFLAGDAAHIVPATGAKGMNLAIADVRILAHALGGFYAGAGEELLAEYTDTVLRRVWRATHFSWWMTTMLHVDPGDDAYGEQLAVSQLRYVIASRAMATSLAENYTGLPYERGWCYR
jgi:p-hydroxybenzoate 3-monooxygenase